MSKDTKIVIVIRKDLKMRRGKECAQAYHAGKQFLIRAAGKYNNVQQQWLDTGTRSIVCVTETEKEFWDLHSKVKQSGVTFFLVLDAGKTEFKEPTHTALAVGPDYDVNIDPLTGHLKLY